MRWILAVTVAATALAAPFSVGARPDAMQKALDAAVAAPGRSPENRARDKYRNSAATLAFFGVRPTDTVVEIWPGGGWYTEILAPYLAEAGRLTVAPPAGKAAERIAARLDADVATYGKVARANFPLADGAPTVAAGSADAVLTFRNVHNWRFGGADKAQAAFDQMFAMLKPGGVLGVEEHRLPEDMDSTLEEKSGYMKRSSVIGFAEKAGFQYVGESQVNANPRDTHDYPKGVWTLPPNFAEGEKDRAKYAAIGESDRMTLKFVKPAR